MTDLRAAVDAVLPATLEDLKKLIAIPSVSSQADHDADVQATADQIAEWLRELGCPDVKVIEEGGKPAVIAHFPAPEGQPTVCLYAHHDVQPAGDPVLWTTPAFEATEHDGRLYGRGSSDDKGGVAVHLAALRAFAGKPPVGVTLFIEGEEEIGSPSLPTILERHHDELAADAFIIADSTNWEVGRPAFTNQLRGLADGIVEVKTIRSGVHSGSYGGAVPDALTVLCKLLATLTDEAGNVAVEGVQSFPAPELDYPEDRLRQEAGLLDGVELIGEGSVAQRLWTKPSISVLAIDTTRIADASNTIIPSATAKWSLRVAPGDDPRAAGDAVVRHLESHAPWGAHVSASIEQCGWPGQVPFEGPISAAAFDAFRGAWGVDPVFIGCGGSIPMIAEFQQAFPGATVLVTAVTDPHSAMHGVDESLDLGDWAKCALAEADLLSRLAR